MNKFFLLITLCCCCAAVSAQDDSALTRTPLHYIVHRTDSPPRIDGKLDDPAWQAASWTEYFSDIEGDARPKPSLKTHVKMLWDDQYLYIGAELEEPNVWAYVQHHDEVVFRDNDFEVFLNPDNNAKHYFEIETNAIGTIFDLFLPEPYRTGGSALVPWNVDGLKKGIHIDGTLNKPGDTDRGWTLELAIPIAEISMGNSPETPQPGSLWRINFSRVEWDVDAKDGRYVKRGGPEHNWVWSPQGVIDMHWPERWGYLVFAGAATTAGPAAAPGADSTWTLPLAEHIKNRLWEICYKERAYQSAHGTFTIDINAPGLSIEATPHTFKAFLTDSAQTWSIDYLGNINRENK